MMRTEVFLQWKGTDACFDLRCECGALSHFDVEFAYYVRCPECAVVYKMPSVLYPVVAQPEEYSEFVKEAIDITSAEEE